MTIPSNDVVARVMRLLIDRCQHGRVPLVALADIAEAGGFSEGECRVIAAELSQAGLFRSVTSTHAHVAPFVSEYAQRLSHCTWSDVLQFARSHRSGSMMRRLMPILAAARSAPPAVTLKAILEFGSRVDEGTLIEAVAVPWFEIMRMIRRDPAAMYQIDPWTWEEIIAGAYKQAGFDEVILTPRSGDKGRDVVATKRGIGSVRFFDQVKAYKPGHLVTAEEVRAMLGVVTGARNVSKGIITTTSEFAPRVASDDFIGPYIPHRLELKPRADLLAWLESLSAEQR